MNGAPTSAASRRAISVFPTPVGPMRMMFLGVTSWRSSEESCCRRQRLRMATATAFLAAACPTMYLSSSATICRGVIESATGLSPVLAKPVCECVGVSEARRQRRDKFPVARPVGLLDLLVLVFVRLVVIVLPALVIGER